MPLSFAYVNISLEALTGTVIYTLVGIILMLVGIIVANLLFKLDLRKELVDEHNVAFGVLIAGFAIAIGIIIAASFF